MNGYRIVLYISITENSIEKYSKRYYLNVTSILYCVLRQILYSVFAEPFYCSIRNVEHHVAWYKNILSWTLPIGVESFVPGRPPPPQFNSMKFKCSKVCMINWKYYTCVKMNFNIYHDIENMTYFSTCIESNGLYFCI